MAKFLLIVIVMVLPLYGCKKGADKPAVQQQAQKVQAAEPQKKEGPAVTTGETKKVETETYSYDPKGRRDPFLSIIAASKKEREVGKKTRAKPAESFDVGDIKVTAIAGDKNGYYAMVQLPDNKYFTVREGMVLGLFGGKVVKIDSQGVVVREYVKDYRGVIQPKDITLKLRKEEGE